MIEVWRIVKNKYNPLDGEGAKKFSGRWHHLGYPCIYTAESLALATLEKLIQLDNFIISEDYLSFLINIPKKNIETFKLKNLPENWHSYPAPIETQDYGTEWIKSLRTAALKVPSAIIQREYNYLINPNHPDFHEITILETCPFIFDKRLFKKIQ